MYFASDNLNVVVGINKKESKEKKNLLEAQSKSFTDVLKFSDSCHRAGKTWISKELPLPHAVKAMREVERTHHENHIRWKKVTAGHARPFYSRNISFTAGMGLFTASENGWEIY